MINCQLIQHPLEQIKCNKESKITEIAECDLIFERSCNILSATLLIIIKALAIYISVLSFYPPRAPVRCLSNCVHFARFALSLFVLGYHSSQSETTRYNQRFNKQATNLLRLYCKRNTICNAGQAVSRICIFKSNTIYMLGRISAKFR